MNDICAGIVLYNPEIDRLQENIEAILPQVDMVYLVDNASNNLEEIRFCFAKNESIRLIENATNRGIAAPLNQLCRAAENDGFDWIVTLDQDSVAFEDMVQAYRPYVERENTAILCPLVVDDREETTIRSYELPEIESVSRCITSGSLTNLFIWRKVGGFDERMFIDCVDFDYCTNVILHGYDVLRVNAARLHHRLGHATEIHAFAHIGRLLHKDRLKQAVYTYNHSPLRTYYYARNSLYYSKKYKGKIDAKTERKVYVKWLVLKLLFEKQRLAKLSAIIRGRSDGRRMFKEYQREQKARTDRAS